MRELGFNVTVYVYDCDPETSLLLYMVDRAIDLFTNRDFKDVVRVSSLAVLVRRFAERARSLKYRALQESRYYYEYQEALSSFARYTSMLLKLLGSPNTLELLLETPIETGFWRSKVLEKAFERLVRYYSVDFHGECPDNVATGLKNVCFNILRGGKTYLVSAEQVARHLASIVPECVFVTASLEA